MTSEHDLSNIVCDIPENDTENMVVSHTIKIDAASQRTSNEDGGNELEQKCADRMAAVFICGILGLVVWGISTTN